MMSVKVAGNEKHGLVKSKGTGLLTRPTQADVGEFFEKKSGKGNPSFKTFYKDTEVMDPESRNEAILDRCMKTNPRWVTAEKLVEEARKKKEELMNDQKKHEEFADEDDTEMIDQEEQTDQCFTKKVYGEKHKGIGGADEPLIDGINEAEWISIDKENSLSLKRLKCTDDRDGPNTTNQIMKKVIILKHELDVDQEWRSWAKTKKLERVNIWNDEWADYIGLFFVVINKYMTLGEVVNMSEANKELEDATRKVRSDEKQLKRNKEEEDYMEALEHSHPYEVPMRFAGWSDNWRVVFEQENQDREDEANREALDFFNDDESGYDSDGHYIPANWGW